LVKWVSVKSLRFAAELVMGLLYSISFNLPLHTRKLPVKHKHSFIINITLIVPKNF
jgi:hypothetical protein